MNDKVDLKRRGLLNSGIAGVAALGVMGVSSAAEKSGAPAIRWDLQTDIICVGSGAAACSAAVNSVDLGNKVILLEKAPIFGGTTRRSGGVAWIPNNFSLKAQGIDDAEADCLRYMARYSYSDRYRSDSPTLGLEQFEFDLLQAYYRNGGPAVARLNEIGAANLIRFELPGGVGPSPDYAATLPENKVPKGRAVWPDPKVTGGRGSSLVDNMIAWLEKRGVKVLTEHQVVKLVQQDGRVVGVEAKTGNKTLRIRARKGVIFGSGGFVHNPELTHRHTEPVYGSCAAAGATGDLIGMATAVGARMGNLGTAWRTQVLLEEALQNPVVGAAINIPPGDAMILVNKHGRRVVNEKRNYNDRTRVHFVWDPTKDEYPNQFLFMLFDQRGIDVYGGSYPFPRDVRESPYLISGASFAELAANIQARLEKLRGKIGDVRLAGDFTRQIDETVQRFSRDAAQGRDEEFHRGRDAAETDWLAYFSRPRAGQEAQVQGMLNRTLYPFAKQGPYYAMILAPGALDTNGGPQINARAQILGGDGQPIPGLFGAGNCIASPTRAAYFGAGGTIGPALTFGYIAAHTANGAKLTR
ncbi:FAD-dependent oxidoreductase [Noviherbaspirillum sedimenti]|uniref:FAD-dependent oxidoreductase n=1 Tax=Noviherbaspirillum sedimenti TaxID=2320865 RepID=A0A3A3G6A7_9BURK|nr:FAD-dependent oxidoreductase [Noviherbaspirillum sedimenti]RJG03354.1 FAD-dependent oxidoreductase [Noviherbaspirillum sedimenti]